MNVKLKICKKYVYAFILEEDARRAPIYLDGSKWKNMHTLNQACAAHTYVPVQALYNLLLLTHNARPYQACLMPDRNAPKARTRRDLDPLLAASAVTRWQKLAVNDKGSHLGIAV